MHLLTSSLPQRASWEVIADASKHALQHAGVDVAAGLLLVGEAELEPASAEEPGADG